MKLLIDTHLLLWAAGDPRKLPAAARRLMADPANVLVFSVASLWEIVIKRTLERADFRADPRALRRGLVDNGYVELPVTGAHALALDALPAHHRDPFDRMLVAQAQVEGLTLLTRDAQLARYGSAVRKV